VDDDEVVVVGGADGVHAAAVVDGGDGDNHLENPEW